jgi:hypothetical protein
LEPPLHASSLSRDILIIAYMSVRVILHQTNNQQVDNARTISAENNEHSNAIEYMEVWG